MGRKKSTSSKNVGQHAEEQHGDDGNNAWSAVVVVLHGGWDGLCAGDKLCELWLFFGGCEVGLVQYFTTGWSLLLSEILSGLDSVSSYYGSPLFLSTSWGGRFGGVFYEQAIKVYYQRNCLIGFLLADCADQDWSV